MRVDVYAPGAPRTARVPVAVSSDDAQEGGGTTGTRVRIDSPDDELGNDGTLPVKPLVTGLRFAGLPVPAGSEIVSARIQFAVDEVGSEPTSYTIAGEAADNAGTYTTKRGSISSRATTTHKVAWSAPPWTAVGDAGPAQLTPDLRDVLQEIVARPGWRTGGAAAFMISGTGRRTAGARDGRAGVPVLVVEYRTELSLRSSVAKAVAGDRVRVFGTTRSSDSSPAAGEAVAIYAYRAPGDAKVLVGRVVSGADGSFAVYDRPRTNTRYVAEVGSLRSRLVPVAVRPRLSAHFVDPTLVKGRTAVVTGLVRPAAAGQPLTLQVWRAGHWRAVATRSQAAGSSRFRFRLTRLGVGRHTYRVVAPAYAGRSQAVTAAMRVTVRRA